MSSMLAFLGRDMAVDLGTANTLVYVRSRGIALNEPSVVALNTNTGKIVAVGVQAKRMIGRTPGNIVVVRPLKDGVIADFDAAERMLCPPELAGDVMDRGIALTGGGALLRGLDERLGEETGMPVYLAANPLESVVLGAGKCVEDFDALQQVLIPDRRR